MINTTNEHLKYPGAQNSESWDVSLPWLLTGQLGWQQTGQGPHRVRAIRGHTCGHFRSEDTIPQLKYFVSSSQCPGGVRNFGRPQRLAHSALGYQLDVCCLMPLEIPCAPCSPGIETGFCAACWARVRTNTSAHSELQPMMKKPIL